MLRSAVGLLTLPLLLAASLNVAADEPEAEIKLFVAADKISEARKRVEEFAPAAPKHHQIYFFDTSGLDLFANPAGPVILRARQKEGKKPQSTVKFRRSERDLELEGRLTAISDELEIQTEAILGKDEVPGISYALDAKIGAELLAEIGKADTSKIPNCFSMEQRKYLEVAGVTVEWTGMRVFGRVDAQVWEWESEIAGGMTELTAELWQLGDKEILEISCKKPGGSLDQHRKEITEYFAKHSIEPASGPGSKTKQALEYFSKNISPSKSAAP